MSLSKTLGTQAVSKSAKAANIPYNSKLRNPTTKVKAFAETDLIILTVNPDLTKVTSTGKLNAKAESAKQMFANYRNKK
jgi:hypothetical protein